MSDRGGRRDYEKAIKLLSDRYGDPGMWWRHNCTELLIGQTSRVTTVKGFRRLQMHYRQLYLPRQA